MTQTTFDGNAIEILGQFPNQKEQAPDFKLTDKSLKDLSLKDFAGKRKILNIVPSLDTPVCATSTRKFNEAAGQLSNTAVLAISADLPFAMNRFCTTEGLSHVTPLSTFRDKDFMRNYGVAIASGPLTGLCARAVIVLDENNRVLHAERVAEIKNEPDYKAALAVLA